MLKTLTVSGGEFLFAKGSISEFGIDKVGNLLFKNTELSKLCESASSRYLSNIEKIKKQREAAKKIEEKRLKERLWVEKEKEEKPRKAYEEIQKKMAEEAAKEQRRKEEEQAKQRERTEKFKTIIESGEVPQDGILYDGTGTRWVKCDYCGKIKKESEFTLYGGARINFGICKDCVHNNPEVLEQKIPEVKIEKKQENSLDICPQCGGKLQKRSGRYGIFWGCSNYPKCKYTRNRL